MQILSRLDAQRGAYVADPRIDTIVDELKKAADFRGTQEAWFERLAENADEMRGRVDGIIDGLSKVDAHVGAVEGKVDRLLEAKAKGGAKEDRKARRDSSFDKNLISRADFDMEPESFATGGSAEVYRAEYDDETVAVKKFKAAGGPREFVKLLDAFSHELKIMCDQHHGSILQVRAAPSPCCL